MTTTATIGQFARLSRRSELVQPTARLLLLQRAMQTLASETDVATSRVRPYAEMPGPTPIPFLGNTWRFIPFIGNFKIHEVDKVSRRLHEEYGDIVKMEGLLNRPDMVFVYDADEIERIFRQEERMPHRPKMPSLDYYKHTLRKDVFCENPGVIAVHGEGYIHAVPFDCRSAFERKKKKKKKKNANSRSPKRHLRRGPRDLSPTEAAAAHDLYNTCV